MRADTLHGEGGGRVGTVKLHEPIGECNLGPKGTQNKKKNLKFPDGFTVFRVNIN
jgi:hypothetical protein